MPFSVIPVKAGIKFFQAVAYLLDPDFRRDDNFLRAYQSLAFIRESACETHDNMSPRNSLI
jgi:hypothetical protein